MTSPGANSGLPGRLLYRGAEADVVQGDWQGLEAVFKVRKPLTYRVKELDETIRRQRTVREAEMLHVAKAAGVPAPYLYQVDIPGSTLVMELVRGKRVKDLMGTFERKDIEEVFWRFGQEVARLHASGIMHGDLTTANVVMRDGRLVFLDFGLSHRTERIEDHAVDLRLIKETLAGAHSEGAAPAMDSLSRGYADIIGRARSRVVLGQLRSIERRGRYARVD